MAAKVISIEIGYALTYICEVDYNPKSKNKNKTGKIYHSITVPTPEGVINDGVVQALPEYVESLRSAIAVNKLKAKQVIFTISSTRIANREIMIPMVKENRIMDVVNANASDYFPVDLSLYKLAYSIIGIEGEKGKQQYKLLVLAAPQALLDGYYTLAKELKLEVAALDYAGNSLYQIARHECAAGTHMLVKVDERSSLVMVVKNQAIVFTRTVAYGVDEAVQTMIDSHAWGEMPDMAIAVRKFSQELCIQLPEQGATAQSTAAQDEEIETLYADEIDETPEETVDGSAQLSEKDKAMADITASLLPLIGGIARVIDFYASRNADAPIERILLTGIGANFMGFDALFAHEVDYPIAVLSQLDDLSVRRYFKDKMFGEYLTAAGAAIAPMSLKTETEKGKGKSKDTAGKGGLSALGPILAFSAFGIGLAVAIALGVSSTLEYLSAQAENMMLKAENSKLEEIIPIYNEYTATLSSYKVVKSMYSMTENRNEELAEFLEELESKMPSSIQVSSFTSTISGVTISMNVATKGEVAMAIEQLRTFDSLQPASVTVNSIAESTDDETGAITVSFTATATYRDFNDRDTGEEDADPADMPEAAQ